MGTKVPKFEARDGSRSLVVLLHAYMSSPERLAAVRNIVAERFPDADLLTPSLPASWASMHQPEEIVANLLRCVDRRWEERRGGYESVLLVGHSLGALLARKLYVCACGAIEAAPFEPGLDDGDLATDRPRPWAQKVERIVLLAGMNRGWQISHHRSLPNAVVSFLGVLVAHFLTLIFQRPPLIMSIRRGAPFITQLRVQWLHMRNRAEARGIGDAMTIQLLGSVDDMVSPEDNIDLASGHDFVYLDIPFSGHGNVIEMADPKPAPSQAEGFEAEPSSIGDARRAVFEAALTEDKATLDRRAIIPSDLPPERQRQDVTDVVFVLHGIRDKGYWTHKVARRVLRLAQEGEQTVRLATETSSYGYFPMLPFLLPTKRRAKVEWFMDRYAETLALYPRAEFSFIGHSNGTYLLARALRDYPACRFKNVVLAGSVVRTGYDWATAEKRKQVKRVLNLVASADWVVAFFPRAIQMLRLQDLGSAGHDGFSGKKAKPGLLSQVRYVRGGHGAALVEPNWSAIARFVLKGDCGEIPSEIKAERQSPLVALPGSVAPLIWVGLLTLAVWIGYGIWTLDLAEWLRTLLFVAYLWGIWKVVTVL